MKFLIRKNKNGELVDFQTAIEEYNYIYQDVEELQEKQGYFIETYYDKEEQILKQKYVEIPKTKEEELEDKLIRLERVLAGNISDDDLIDLPLEAKPNSLNARGKDKPKKKLIEPTTDDLAELDNLI